MVITINSQSVKADVVDRPKTDVVGKMWYVIWGVPMETKVLTSSSSIFYLLTYFSSSRRLVNKHIQVIEASGRAYIVGILIQLTISGFAWFTAFKYMFLFNLWRYECFYCKSNLRNGFIMPDLYEKVILFVFLCYLVQKLWNLLTFAIRLYDEIQDGRQMNPMGH